MQNQIWSREELILAFNLYCKLDFDNIHYEHPQIEALSRLVRRSPNAVALKLTRLASADPCLREHYKQNLPQAGNAEHSILQEFHSRREVLAFESELTLAKFENQTIEKKFREQLQGIYKLTGEERRSYIRTRVNQHFFRKMILANYHSRCAITGIDIPVLLGASQIVSWKKSSKERLNPQNGICLSALYDKAFQQGLIGFDENYCLILSPELEKDCSKPFYRQHFGQLAGRKMTLPHRGAPSQRLLKWHRENKMQPTVATNHAK